MECKYCGKEIPDDSTFCPDCGKPINNIKSSYKGLKFKILSLKSLSLKSLSLKSILVIIAIGIWMLVLQNLGITPVTQDVSVENTVDVSGTVDVGNTVDVSGTVNTEVY